MSLATHVGDDDDISSGGDDDAISDSSLDADAPEHLLSRDTLAHFDEMAVYNGESRAKRRRFLVVAVSSADPATAIGGARYLHSAVMGAITGLSTTLMTLCASYGVHLSARDIASMCFSNLFGDGVSLGISDAVGSWIAQRHGRAQLADVRRRVREDRQEAIKRICKLYSPPPSSIESAMADDAHYRRAMFATFDDGVLVALLGAHDVTACALRDVIDFPKDGSDSNNNNNNVTESSARASVGGIVTSTAFVLCGSLALLSMYAGNMIGDAAHVSMTHYVADDGSQPVQASNLGFYLAGAVTTLALFGLGALNSRYTHLRRSLSGLLMVASGLPIAILVYGLSSFIDWLMLRFAP